MGGFVVSRTVFIAIFVSALALQGCGGGNEAASPPTAPQAVVRPQAQIYGYSGDYTTYLDWQEQSHPDLYPRGTGVQGWISPYQYRYYPLTSNYLGYSLANNTYYKIGLSTDWQLVALGNQHATQCEMSAWNCLAPESAVAVLGSPAVDAERLFNLAESAYPTAFGPHATTGYMAPFVYRDYPQTHVRAMIAVDSGTAYAFNSVYVQGGQFGLPERYVGQLPSLIAPSQPVPAGNIQAYQGIWLRCERVGFGQSYLHTYSISVQDATRLTIDEVSVSYASDSCTGHVNFVEQRGGPANTFTFQGVGSYAGWDYDKFIRQGLSSGQPYSQKTMLQVRGDKLWEPAVSSTDASGYPRGIEYPDFPFVRQ